MNNYYAVSKYPVVSFEQFSKIDLELTYILMLDGDKLETVFAWDENKTLKSELNRVGLDELEDGETLTGFTIIPEELELWLPLLETSSVNVSTVNTVDRFEGVALRFGKTLHLEDTMNDNIKVVIFEDEQYFYASAESYNWAAALQSAGNRLRVIVNKGRDHLANLIAWKCKTRTNEVVVLNDNTHLYFNTPENEIHFNQDAATCKIAMASDEHSELTYYEDFESLWLEVGRDLIEQAEQRATLLAESTPKTFS